MQTASAPRRPPSSEGTCARWVVRILLVAAFVAAVGAACLPSSAGLEVGVCSICKCFQEGHKAEEAHVQGGWFESPTWLLLWLLWELHACQAVLSWRVGFAVHARAPGWPPSSGGTCARWVVQILLVAAFEAAVGAACMPSSAGLEGGVCSIYKCSKKATTLRRHMCKVHGSIPPRGCFACQAAVLDMGVEGEGLACLQCCNKATKCRRQLCTGG
jgi:hypothetical protein